MDKSDIHLSDLHRILFGSAPVVFLAETAFRTVITYVVLLVMVKGLGKRMSGQLTITELAITIMLGAIVAPPMETPERGLLQGALILFLILLYHQWLALANVRNARLEGVVQGRLSIFVKDGILQLEELRLTNIARAQLIAVLREKEIYNLGKVKRLYMEACGVFTVMEMKEARPGLSLLPAADGAIHSMQEHPDPELQACISCGNVVHIKKAEQAGCKLCANRQWDTAVL